MREFHQKCNEGNKWSCPFVIMAGQSQKSALPYLGVVSPQKQYRTRSEPEAKEQRTRTFRKNRVLSCSGPLNMAAPNLGHQPGCSKDLVRMQQGSEYRQVTQCRVSGKLQPKQPHRCRQLSDTSSREITRLSRSTVGPHKVHSSSTWHPHQVLLSMRLKSNTLLTPL